MKDSLWSLMASYSPEYPEEKEFRASFLELIEKYPNCCERSLGHGHITGSAWIVSPDRKQCVLLHHKKLDRWLQPGGHADGERDVFKVALKEAQEETGLMGFMLPDQNVFDIDIHEIPARGSDLAHLHYDIRFLLVANPSEGLPGNEESHRVEWIDLSKVEVLVHGERSIMRMVEKTMDKWTIESRQRFS
jgi:8-oxo-dGTP pyrophosphatase MutT (NUDIX family)